MPRFVEDEFRAFLRCGFLAKRGALKIPANLGRVGATPTQRTERNSLTGNQPSSRVLAFAEHIQIQVSLIHVRHRRICLSGRGDGTPSSIDAVLNDQICRGPDHCAIAEVSNAPTVVLGHNRLAILDLSPRSHQPMWDHAGQFCAVFGGEIYNYVELREELKSRDHRFVTDSDTEVLIEAWKEWGSDSIASLNGMFAFALWNNRQRELYLVRDRFGVKPLYYTANAESVCWASTSRALARTLRLFPSQDYVARGLRYWVYEDDLDTAPYEGMKALAPGTFLRIQTVHNTLSITSRRFYALTPRVEVLRAELAECSEHDLKVRTHDLLSSAIRLRLRADVPIGVSLSSGIDSSTIAAIMLEQSVDFVAVSFAHPNEFDSEGPLVAELQRHCRFPVEWVWPSTKEIIDAFYAALDAQDAPFPDGSVVAHHLVYRRAKELGLKVMIEGEGGDETFLGYRKFPFLLVRQHLDEKRPLAALATSIALLPTIVAELPSARKYWRLRFRYRKAIELGSVVRLPTPKPVNLGAERGQSVWRRQIADVVRYSLPSQLRYADRSSMAHSIEVRLPFLDYRLVEWGIALPDQMKWRHGYTKWVIREIARGRIPDSLRCNRRKRGFYVNQARWIRNGLGNAVRKELRKRGQRVRSWLPDQVNIEQAFSDDRLCRELNAFGEATTLLWLADRRPLDR